MKGSTRSYLPALAYEWLTPLYDPVLQWLLRESIFKQELIRQAQIASGQRVLDLGCGTATLTLLIKQAHPGAEVMGLDADPKVLQIAHAKLGRSQLAVTLTQADASVLPYPDNTFDRVLSSLFFHHLTREQKEQTLQEVYRVLVPGGQFHVADWGKAQDLFMRLAFFSVQFLDGFATTKDSVQGIFPALCQQAQFEAVEQTMSYRTLFGTLSLYQACKPLSSS